MRQLFVFRSANNRPVIAVDREGARLPTELGPWTYTKHIILVAAKGRRVVGECAAKPPFALSKRKINRRSRNNYVMRTF